MDMKDIATMRVIEGFIELLDKDATHNAVLLRSPEGTIIGITLWVIEEKFVKELLDFLKKVDPASYIEKMKASDEVIN